MAKPKMLRAGWPFFGFLAIYIKRVAEPCEFSCVRKMSQIQRQNRVASDFSIARILAEDSNKKKSRQSLSNEFVDCHRNDRSYLLQTGSSHIERLSQEEINRTDSIGCSRIVENYVNDHRANVYHSSFANFGISDSRNERTFGVNNLLHESSDIAMKSVKIEKSELSWLQCTRYRPPKLPRKSTAGKSGKRRPGAHPRIPFTANQLQVLEDKYRRTAYLSRRDVIQLSTALRLPQSRVKIWFQNRRARDRRESCSNNATILSNDVSQTDKPKDVPNYEPMTSSLI